MPTHRIAANPGTTLLIDELTGCIMQHNEPVTLVLDDLHEISSRTVTASVALLLRRASPRLRLVLLTRHNPPLPTARYRIGGSYTEIRGPELAFTANEASELVGRTFFSLSGAGTTALVTQTQGWAGGMRLFFAPVTSERSSSGPASRDASPSALL